MTSGEPKLPENLDAVPLTLNLRRILATTEALFQLDGAVLIQRYCDKCLSKANYEMSL